MENEEKAENVEGQAGVKAQTQGRGVGLSGNSEPVLERALERLRKAIWILAVLTALACVSSVVTMTMAKKALEGVGSHAGLTGELNESLREIQKTATELRKMIEELSETEEEGPQGDTEQMWNGKI